MYCPKCAAANMDEAKFCRGCGANIGSVLQALKEDESSRSFGLYEEPVGTVSRTPYPTVNSSMAGVSAGKEESSKLGMQKNSSKLSCDVGAKNRVASLEHGIRTAFMGLAFMLVSLCVFRFFPGGKIWFFWLLIPAFMFVGRGVGEIMQIKYGPKESLPTASSNQSNLFNSEPVREFNRNTGELPSFTSVTEETTRHLERK
jgi:hypothetical protein